ncbi:TetR/AcrR family transcriptional regulator [Nocardia nepalensis]|uniref:TetR/AcrR family transcriptional regulator n=1 Tax=Nocardia nepalensis TaxID=3375448 RepID=UPI003B67CB82
MNAATADSERRRPYHHGALHTALIEASVELARAGGPDRVVLREAARVAGVSHSAAYRHFADREALLAEVSRQARAELAAEMRRHIDMASGPGESLQAVGVAYIDFALTQPGLFRAAFTSHPAANGNDVQAQDNPSAVARSDGASRFGAGAEPFDILGQVLDETMAAGLLAPDRRPGAEIAVWSAVHGLASLLLDGPLPVGAADIEYASNRVFELIGRGLFAAPDQAE